MSGELQAQHVTGATLYSVLLDSSGAVWNGAAFDATPTAAEWATYAVTMAEDSSTGCYRGDLPGGAGAGRFLYRVHKRLGVSPATTDPVVWTDEHDTRLANLDAASSTLATASALSTAQTTLGTLATSAALSSAQSALAAAIAALPSVAAIWSGITAAAARTIADHTLRRSWASAAASADGDALSFRSLLGAVAKLVNRVGISGSTLTVYEDDDTTALGTQTATSDAAADPITGVNTD